MSNRTVVPKTNVTLSIKSRENGTEYLEFILADKVYEFDAPAEYVRNEENPDIVALTYAAIIRIANEENVTFETRGVYKNAYNHCTVHVVAKSADGRMRESLIGKNKDNMPSDAKGDADNAAHKKACVEAFLALYGLSSSRFNVKSGKTATKKGSGINLNVVDGDDIESDDEHVPSAPAVSEPVNNVTSDESSKHATTPMPFGTKKNQTVFSILAEPGGLSYFSRLYSVNQAVKNNAKISDAIFAYYEDKSVSEEEQKMLSGIREAISG
jgi:hypothetical protein